MLHSIEGFSSNTLHDALNEAYAVSRGTKCTKFLYSLSLNPPPNKNVPTEVFEEVIGRVEIELGLSGQSRVIIFHEKESANGQTRRHAHAVWNRIDCEEMKAVQISWDRKKLQSLSREIFIEQNWSLPRGYINAPDKSPKNFTHAEWQQAKRVKKDPREIKTAFQDAWAISDSKSALTQALAERGYKVARGDQRGFVALDIHGEIFSIPRKAGVKTSQVRERLGDVKALPSIADVKNQIAHEMLPTLDKFQQELNEKKRAQLTELKTRKAALVQRQRKERQVFTENLETRRVKENKTRQARFRTGLKGVWDRLRGEHKRIQTQNMSEAQAGIVSDRGEKDQLIFKQIVQRQQLSAQHTQNRQRYKEQRQE